MANSGMAKQSWRDNEPLPLLSKAVNLEYKRSIWAEENPVSSLIKVISSSCNMKDGLLPILLAFANSWPTRWTMMVMILINFLIALNYQQAGEENLNGS